MVDLFNEQANEHTRFLVFDLNTVAIFGTPYKTPAIFLCFHRLSTVPLQTNEQLTSGRTTSPTPAFWVFYCVVHSVQGALMSR